MMNNSKFVKTNISNLWQAYVCNSLYVCFNKHALQTIEDEKIRNVYALSQQIAENHVQQLKELFSQFDFSIPIGFTDADVNLKAPRLFTDHFLLFSLNEMAAHGAIGYSLSLSTSVSKQVQDFNVNAFKASSDLYNKSLELMQELKLFDDFPDVPLPGNPEFAHKQNFMASLIKVPPRPLDIIEITSIYTNLRKTIMHKALAIAYSQTASTKEVKDMMVKSIETPEKNIDEFAKVLHDDFIPAPRYWDNHITDSTIAPFSDKLMLMQIATLISLAISNYGSGMSVSTRLDLGLLYTTAIARKGKLGLDFANLMIKHGWLEQPPLAADRRP
jgi:hypothetical protein